jgi:hypothetical protein
MCTAATAATGIAIRTGACARGCVQTAATTGAATGTIGGGKGGANECVGLGENQIETQIGANDKLL